MGTIPVQWPLRLEPLLRTQTRTTWEQLAPELAQPVSIWPGGGTHAHNPGSTWREDWHNQFLHGLMLVILTVHTLVQSKLYENNQRIY